MRINYFLGAVTVCAGMYIGSNIVLAIMKPDLVSSFIHILNTTISLTGQYWISEFTTNRNDFEARE